MVSEVASVVAKDACTSGSENALSTSLADMSERDGKAIDTVLSTYVAKVGAAVGVAVGAVGSSVGTVGSRVGT